MFLNVIGHGSSIFRDGKRLVLNTFLLTAALWAQIDFIATLISPTATSSCQIGVIFTTLFDQLARFSIEQHLLWVISDGTKAGALQYIMQALLTARFILGIVFVVLSKPNFNLVCVSFSSVFIVAAVVVAVDAVVLLGLFGQAIVAGVFSRMADGGQSSTRGKAVIAVMVGLALWMGVSNTSVVPRACKQLLTCTTDQCRHALGPRRQWVFGQKHNPGRWPRHLDQ